MESHGKIDNSTDEHGRKRVYPNCNYIKIGKINSAYKASILASG